MLQQIFARVRDLLPADECECRDVLTTVRDLGQLALKIADVRFEVVALPHFDSEKMVIVPLSLPARVYWVRNVLDTSSKLWIECGGRE